MKYRTWSSAIAVTLFATLALSLQLAGQDKQDHHRHHKYELIDLGTLGGPNSYNESLPPESIINLHGAAAAYADTSVSDPFCVVDCFVNHAFVWKDGVTTDLGALPGGANSFASSINARGEVAGASQNGQIDPLTAYPEIIAVRWKNGTIDNLGTLGGTQSVANAVSDRGQVAGAALNVVSDPFANSPLPCNNCGSFAQFFLFVPAATEAHAFRWTEAGGMQDLGALGGPDSSASFVNQRGQIAGEFFTSFTANPSTGVPTVDPFFWEKGKMVDIGTLGGTLGYPFWMNSRGQIVGDSNLAGDQTTHAFLWDKKGGLKDLGTLGGTYSNANWINDGGEIVGGSNIPADAEYHPFLWKNGVMTDLGSVAGDICNGANSINSQEQVVGFGSADCNSEDHAFLSENGGPVMDLQGLVSPGSGLTLINAVFINDMGEIAARAKLTNGDEHAVALFPCDENHPGVEGCDYSLVDTTAATQNPELTTFPAKRSARHRGGPIGITPLAQYRRVDSSVK
jgi:probable HAF family extracellular repeat protein